MREPETLQPDHSDFEAKLDRAEDEILRLLQEETT